MTDDSEDNSRGKFQNVMIDSSVNSLINFGQPRQIVAGGTRTTGTHALISSDEVLERWLLFFAATHQPGRQQA